MATIRDVAELAGVSTATVSHVINNTRTVLPDTRESVLAAVAQLNYRPSAIARSLSTSITHTVGIVVADITNPFFAELVRGIETRLALADYNLIVCNTDERPERERRYLDLLYGRRVDGVIISSTGGDHSIYNAYVRSGIPLVFVDRQPPQRYGPSITGDNVRAGFAATTHLLDLGHRRVAILLRHPTLSTAAGRLAGFRQAFEARQIPVPEGFVVVTDSQMDAAYHEAMGLLSRPDRPTAVIAANHLMALGLLRATQEIGLACPEELSLICFDDQPWATLFRPHLTVVAQPVQALCDTAVDLFLGAVQRRLGESDPQIPSSGVGADGEDVVLETQLIVRDSCGPPPPV